jgi:hypothetical protein
MSRVGGVMGVAGAGQLLRSKAGTPVLVLFVRCESFMSRSQFYSGSEPKSGNRGD